MLSNISLGLGSEEN
uniref:Uncharacterized protein n=1 Tax=Rhizophora mucronata TaxID=61149 RepID=A0A2P2PH18_RHIMU